MAVASHPSPAVVGAVNEQVTWWRTRGVTAHDAAASMGMFSHFGWEPIRRAMERWLVRKRGA